MSSIMSNVIILNALTSKEMKTEENIRIQMIIEAEKEMKSNESNN